MDILRQINRRWFIIVVILLAGVLLAGCMAPQFTYQEVLTNASGNLLNGSVTITYRIFNDETGGTEIHSETETVTVTDGRFNSVIGPSLLDASMDPADLAQALWIEIQIDDGTYVETLEPRQKLYGAPYAFTLIPGSVISGTIGPTLYGGSQVDAVTSVINMETTDPFPALRVQGEQGLELVDVSGSFGTIYSEIAAASSDLQMFSNDDILFYLNNNDDADFGYFYVYGDPATNYCRINYAGNLYCTGSISSASLMNGESHSLYAMQSPDVRIEDFGSAQLSKGSVTVQVDSMFVQSVNLDVDYHVFLTPLGECNCLYVTNKTATSFEVRELGSGTSEVSFDYRIVAKRAGYEDQRMEVVPGNSEGLGR